MVVDLIEPIIHRYSRITFLEQFFSHNLLRMHHIQIRLYTLFLVVRTGIETDVIVIGTLSNLSMMNLKQSQDISMKKIILQWLIYIHG